jgi:hypothetical protein
MPPPPLPEMFNGLFSSSAAQKMLAQVLASFPQLKALPGNDPEAVEKSYFNAGQAIHDSLVAQDKQPFLSALNWLKDKAELLSKPGTMKDDDIVRAVTNELNTALTLAKKSKAGYQQFEDTARDFLIANIVTAENQQRNAVRPPQDKEGNKTEQEEYSETFNDFSVRYGGQRLRQLVGPPPEVLRIGKSDAPDEYYLWGVYGLKKDPSMDFGEAVDGNIAAYSEATSEIEVLVARYGAGTPKADEKTLDDPGGNFKRSPNEFRSNARAGLIKAVTKFHDTTKDRVENPANPGAAKSAIIRSIALVESLRGAFGLANGPTSHSMKGLSRNPSDADRQKFEAQFPGIQRMWEATGEAVRKDIEATPDADRSERDPVVAL